MITLNYPIKVYMKYLTLTLYVLQHMKSLLYAFMLICNRRQLRMYIQGLVYNMQSLQSVISETVPLNVMMGDHKRISNGYLQYDQFRQIQIALILSSDIIFFNGFPF